MSFPPTSLSWTEDSPCPSESYLTFGHICLLGYLSLNFPSGLKSLCRSTLTIFLVGIWQFYWKILTIGDVGQSLTSTMRLIWLFFLATWLSWRIFNDSSTSIWLEAFHITVEMARHKPYSFGIPYLAWAYRYLREFKETFGQVAMTYGPWVLVVDRLRCYFPHSHNTMTW